MQKMIFALILSAAVVMAMTPFFIPMLRRHKYRQVERAEGPHANTDKEGTPSMGGLMFILSITLATVAFSMYDIAFSYSIPALIMMVAFGAVGFLDDYTKVKHRRNLGLRAWQKIVVQLLLSGAIAFFAYTSEFIGPSLVDPIFGEINLGPFYIPFIMFTVIAIVNSANLTDGLDGLLSGVSLIYSIAMGIIFLYFAGVFSRSFVGEPLMVAQSDGMLSMGVFAFATAGGCLGFLMSNSHPARVFMGDTGSMALGGAMSAMVIYSRAPFLFLLMGSCIVAAAVSDVLQVASYKLRHGKRIFRMAPLHHHFELKGYSETKIVCGYMIVTTICCLVALALFL